VSAPEKPPEPVRVKVYGLFALTRRRYLFQAASGGVCIVALLLAWYFGWPALKERLERLPAPPVLSVMIQVLEWAPWILIATAVYKFLEIAVVLRCFARKAAAAAPPPTAPGPQLSQTQKESSPWPSSTPPAS
jgi:hypothetical protein